MSSLPPQKYFLLSIAIAWAEPGLTQQLSSDELQFAQRFALSSLPEPIDLGNDFAHNPQAAALGKALFFDNNLSVNNKVSCGTCHDPETQFQDNIPLAVGMEEGSRRTMPLTGAQWSPWLFWDGRKDSLWSQALEPIESSQEHGLTRTEAASHLLKNYNKEYRQVFGDTPLNVDRWPSKASPNVGLDAADAWDSLTVATQFDINSVFSNLGKAIASFEITLRPQKNKLDKVIESNPTTPSLTDEELAGYRLFIGKAGCTHCHSGPRYTDDFFHNTGVPNHAMVPDIGRIAAFSKVTTDPFNCKGLYSSAEASECDELTFMSTDFSTSYGAYKTPSLRGVSLRSPYMHQGQFANLLQVLKHYNEAPTPMAEVAQKYGKNQMSELTPLNLSNDELQQLKSFLEIL